MAYGYALDLFQVDGRAHIGHAGGMVGHYALLWCDMDAGVAAAMMVNGHGEREPSVRFALDAARAHLAGKTLPTVTPAPDPLATPIAAQLAGTYASGDGGVIALKDDDGRVVATTAEGDVTLEPLQGIWDEDGADRFFAVPIPAMDRLALGAERDTEGEVVAVTHGPTRYVRAGATVDPDEAPPPDAHQMTGTYRTWNPWSPGFRVFIRGGRLMLATPVSEKPLTPLRDGEWRVGDERNPDRVRFDTVVDGSAQHAVYNALLYSRSFLD